MVAMDTQSESDDPSYDIDEETERATATLNQIVRITKRRISHP